MLQWINTNEDGVSICLQAFWKEKGFSGEIVAGSSSNCPFCVTFDATSPRGNPALVGFIAAQQASHWSPEEVRVYTKTVAGKEASWK